MKTKKELALNLKKETVANLNEKEMNFVNGGSYFCTYEPTDIRVCRTMTPCPSYLC